MNPPSSRSHVPCGGLLTLGLAALFLTGCAHTGAPQTFGSPDDAVKALTSAVRADDMPKVTAIMGKDAKEIISSGDDVADRERRQEFLALYDQKHALEDDGPAQRTLVVGGDDWPFPVPLVKQGDKWRFDPKAGKEEILNRRIGDNELSAIQVCDAIGDAQHEYAQRDPQHTGVNPFAQKFASDPGQRNGLFWPTAEGEEPSPLGELVADAAAEGYRRHEGEPTPYHGYCYRILKAQGPNAPNGALDYIVDGHMTLGFAVVAYPAKYGNSGVMTFIMGPDGVVYQQNLGDDTEEEARAMTTFDPGEGWAKVEPQPDAEPKTAAAAQR